MKKVLLIGHVRDNEKSSGGIVYLDGLCQLLRNIYPGVGVDSLYCAEATSRNMRPLRQLAAIGRAVVSAYPSKVLYFRSGELASRILCAFEKNHYDLVFVSQAEMLWTLDLIPEGVPVVHISQNVEHRLYHQLTERLWTPPLVSNLLRKDARKYREFEIGGVRNCRGVICISADDEHFFRSQIEGLNSLTVPPLFSYPLAARRGTPEDRPIRLGFVANLQWWPNREAISWFRRNIVSALPAGMTLHCFGRGSESLGRTPPVIGHGFVADVREVWQSFDVMIAPMFSGAGINVKVAEAIYNGLPLVCTSHALRGLPVRRDDAIAVLDSREEWIAALNGNEIHKLSLSSGNRQNSDIFCFESGRDKLQAFLATIVEEPALCAPHRENVD